MTCIAILIGVTDYDSQTNLPCCKDDIAAMRALIEATGKFSEIKVVCNGLASDVKDELREFLSSLEDGLDEVFFYFTGHGIETDEDFFFCMSDFDTSSSHTTGLSNQELHSLIRALKPAVFVKVIDACESGTQLIKSTRNLERYDKGSFNSFIQMAACQNTQAARTGTPLSLFTERFIDASLLKDDGPVYYTDIRDGLRDAFAKDNFQTPYFVNQGTGREVFVGDAGLLAKFSSPSSLSTTVIVKASDDETLLEDKPTLIEQLESRNHNRADPEQAQAYIDRLSSAISEMIENIPAVEVAYSLESRHYNDYYDIPSKLFIVPILEREPRTDRLVKSYIYNPDRDGLSSSLARISALTTMAFRTPEEKEKSFHLSLSCSLMRVQWVFDLVPKFESLQKFSISVSFVPSYPTCYVFAVTERHMMTDWGTFSNDSTNQGRIWFKGNWSENSDRIVTTIRDEVSEHIDKYFESEGLNQENS